MQNIPEQHEIAASTVKNLIKELSKNLNNNLINLRKQIAMLRERIISHSRKNNEEIIKLKKHLKIWKTKIKNW